MKPFSALIVDDEAPARKRIRDLLAGEPDISVVGECADGKEAVEAIRGHRPDIVFLDVQMPGHDGFEVLREVGLDAVPAVVFVTAHDEHALEAFDARALDYLLKPFSRGRFRESLGRARRQLERGPDDELREQLEGLVGKGAIGVTRRRVPLRSAGRITFLDVDEIDWVEACGNYVKLHAGDVEHMMRSTLAGMVQRLGPRFVRIHHSHAVNVDRIEELQPWSRGEYRVVLRGGTKLRASRSYAAAVERLLEF